MLQAPRGRAGAAFLQLAIAARTMAGGTSPGDLGPHPVLHVAPRSAWSPLGGGVCGGWRRGAWLRGSPVRPPLGWDAAT